MTSAQLRKLGADGGADGEADGGGEGAADAGAADDACKRTSGNS